MASDEEYESFKITDFDLECELNPSARRHKQTKEQAIYGVWANSDDEIEGHMQRNTRKKRGRVDYVEPMGFVSGGVFGDKDEEKDAKKEVKFEASINKDACKRQQKNSKQFGAWEKYTTGFGSKMLERMGYQGKGLGKRGEGITEPVKAFKRNGRAALGAYGSENPVVESELAYNTDEEEEIKIRSEIENLQQWKKTRQEVKKPKYMYKTAEEVKQNSSSIQLAPLLSSYGNVKVVDMTGPDTRVLQGYGSIGHQHAKPGEGEKTGVTDSGKPFDIPELVYNLNLLVDLAESEILKIDRQLQFENDNVVNMSHEKGRLEKVLKEEEIEVENLEFVTKVVERCKIGMQPDEDEPLTLESLIKCFQKLQDNSYEEYKLYHLDELVVPLGFPLLLRHFESWQPFLNATHGLEEITLWKRILKEDENGLNFSKKEENRSMKPFERIIWEVWMPHIRTATGTWQARNPDPLINVLETWMNIIPDWVRDNILEQLVMPKLLAAVDFWNPLIDHVPIHSWIHPWLPLMGEHLEPLYGPIRHKLAMALTNWHPSDPSVKAILEPWVKVFSRGALEAFLLRSIYPKLEQCMSDFKINPHQQMLEPFHWVMSWQHILSLHHMVSIFDKHLFPKWLQVLRHWLNNSPNFDEVTKWYLGWKTMFGSKLFSNPSVKENFNRALTLMNEAVNGTMQPGAKENVAYLTSTERRLETRNISYRTEKLVCKASPSIPARFKDIVEKTAEDNDILFIPIPNRKHEGKAVYSFGKSVIYIDREVVFRFVQGTWKPSSLQDLLDCSR